MRDMVELHINGKKWRHFSDFELTLGLDSYSACGFRAPHGAAYVGIIGFFGEPATLPSG